jgi:hypothetical protein
MFGDDDSHKIQTLSRMISESFQLCQANQIEAHEKLKVMIARDRRFDGLDPGRLADKARECGQSGSRLNLEDPSLRRGSAKPAQNWTAPPRSAHR